MFDEILHKMRIPVGALAVLLATISSLRPAIAATSVAAGEVGGQSWTAAGSPYVVEGTITVAASTTLSIGAGTTVLFATSPSSGGFSLHVTGSLIVQGRPDDRVTFQAETGNNPMTWLGIMLGAGSSTIEGAVIRHAAIPITSAGTLTVRQSIFEADGDGPHVTGGMASFDGISVTGAGVGLFVLRQGGTATVTNSIFSHNTLDGLAATGGVLDVRNSTIDHNMDGVYMNGGLVTIRSSIISNSRIAGIQTSAFDADVRVSTSDFWNNLVDFTGEISAQENIAAAPGFVSDTDYHLRPDSPCIDAVGATDSTAFDFDLVARPIEGDGVVDPDQTSFDMGAYEFDPSRDAGTTAQADAEAPTDVAAVTDVVAVTDVAALTDVAAVAETDAADAVTDVADAPATADAAAGNGLVTLRGCSCRVGAHGNRDGGEASWFALVLAALAALRSRRAKPRRETGA